MALAAVERSLASSGGGAFAFEASPGMVDVVIGGGAGTGSDAVCVDVVSRVCCD